MMRKIAPVVAAALVASAVAVLAANTTFFTSNGDTVFPFSPPTGAGINGTIGDAVRGGMAPVNGNLAYSKAVPLTGFGVYVGNFQHVATLNPAGTLANGYVYLPLAPIDGGEFCIFSTQTITALSLVANVGQTINNAVTTLAANTKACYLYSQANATWDRD